MVTDEGEVLGTGCNNLRIILIIQINLNPVNHEQVGETFLQQLGFPPEVTQFVRGHVQVRPRIVDIGSISAKEDPIVNLSLQAKRYLVYKNPDYHARLSDASKGTLIHQGGPMTTEEAEEFEELTTFDAILSMRGWDEQAKDADVKIVDNKKYKDMIINILANQNNK